MKLVQMIRFFLVFAIALLSVPYLNAESVSLWVGETHTFERDQIEVPFGWDGVVETGHAWKISESTKKYIQMGTSGSPRNNVTILQFYTGTKYITCTTSYYLFRTIGGSQDISDMKTKDQRFYIDCKTVDVTLYPTSMNLEVGETGQIQYQFNPVDSKPAATITFSSSNSAVAEVDFKGNVYAKGVGTAVITAKTNFETTATCQVKVNPTLATSVSLNKKALKLKIGESQQLVATVLPANASNKSVRWVSSDEEVASVDKNGVVVAKSVGNAQISAITQDGSNISASCDVDVFMLAEDITLDMSEKKIGIGEAFLLTAQVAPSEASDVVTWESSNPSVAYVDSNGKVEGLQTGVATITAKTTDGTNLSASCEVVVVRYVSDIQLSSYELDLAVGEEAKLTAIVNPSNATEQTLLWESADKSVAEVEDGLVRALRNGTTDIIVSAVDGSNIRAFCRVAVKTLVSSILIEPKEFKLSVGGFKQLEVSILPESATNKDLVWSSSEPSVAGVQNGLVLGFDKGIATISASATDDSGVVASCTVEVVDDSSVDNVDLSTPKVYAENGAIFMENFSLNETCRIFRLDGIEVYHEAITNYKQSFSPNLSGGYLVMVGNKSYKVIVM